MKKIIVWTMALVFALSVSMAFAADEKATPAKKGRESERLGRPNLHAATGSKG